METVTRVRLEEGGPWHWPENQVSLPMGSDEQREVSRDTRTLCGIEGDAVESVTETRPASFRSGDLLSGHGAAHCPACIAVKSAEHVR